MNSLLHVYSPSHMIPIMHISFFDYLESIPHRHVTFPAKKMVVAMDDPIESLFIVKSGMVNLVRFQEDGSMVILQRAGPGAIMAEASVFSEGYHCAAVAVQKSKLQVYPMSAVRTLLANTPEAALAYARHLAGEVRESRKRAEILALKTVAERLSAWLVWNHGDLPPKGERHHVAEEIGVSREALYRELAKRR